MQEKWQQYCLYKSIRRNDARGIAAAMRSGLYTEVVPKSQQALEIGTLLGSRRLLVNQKVAVTNAIRGFLKTYGIRLGSCGEKGFAEAVRKTYKAEHGLAIQIDLLLYLFGGRMDSLQTLSYQRSRHSSFSLARFLGSCVH
ncbi:MAG: hypothetical protein KR126chlam3_01358 [Chlamydiae bacterium]|nr:hypothetical protein [Chlamydiota bacterium]